MNITIHRGENQIGGTIPALFLAMTVILMDTAPMRKSLSYKLLALPHSHK